MLGLATIKIFYINKPSLEVKVKAQMMTCVFLSWILFVKEREGLSLVEGGRLMTFVFFPSFLFGRGRESLGGFYLVEGGGVMTLVFLPRFLFGRGRERDDLCFSPMVSLWYREGE